MHRFLLHNGRIQDAAEKTLSPAQAGLMTGWGVFSTLRVSQGALFAFERHWARMRRDAERMRVPFPTEAESFKSDLLRLVAANQANEAALRVCVVRNRGGIFAAEEQARDFDVVAFTADLADWGESARLDMKRDARQARNQFAGSKILSWAENLTWHEEARARGFDEVILLNESGEVSECTSANIFAIEGDRVWTPPLSSGCLAGVTRQVLLDEIRVPGIAIAEKTFAPVDLERVDQVFMTSTTRDLLPVREITSLKIRQNGRSTFERLLEALVEYRRDYIAKSRAAGARV
jgi:branched-chain amino acid aminotransferase